MQDDCPCHVLHPDYAITDGGIDCDYFLTAVLPSDKELHDRVQAAIYGGALNSPSTPVKKCARCAKPFIPRGNRQVYCSTCAEEAMKEQRRARQIKKYRADRKH